jgi:excisionase family DNA binding protein
LQRYLKKETQRIKQKSSGSVLELKLVETEPAPPPPDKSTENPRIGTPGDAFEARQAPVPGVSREEAIQVSDDQIGKTVQPYTYRDYRGIRPLTGDELFDSSQASTRGNTDSVAADEAILSPVATEEIELAGEIPIGSTVEVISKKLSGEKKVTATVEAPNKESEKKKKGRKKAGPDNAIPGLFDSVSEHGTSARFRLTRKSKLDREELIDKLLDPVISLEEASTLIGVCKTTVRRYTNKGELECLRTPGSQRRFKLSQVLEFVKKREVSQAPHRGRKKKGE